MLDDEASHGIALLSRPCILDSAILRDTNGILRLAQVHGILSCTKRDIARELLAIIGVPSKRPRIIPSNGSRISFSSIESNLTDLDARHTLDLCEWCAPIESMGF